jgi:hypothetical protein
LMDVDWQATGSRSELWDRRQVFSKNRMGAQALSRAREELRPRGLCCLHRNELRGNDEIYVAFADISAGEHRRGLDPILRSRRTFQGLVMRLSIQEIAAEVKWARFWPASMESDSGILIVHCPEEQQRL